MRSVADNLVDIDRPDLMNVGDLWGRGWSVIPLRPRDKRPALPSWTPYQKRQPAFEELEQWFWAAPTANVGIVTGKVSGIFVIDCDSTEAIAWASEHLPPCEMRVRTAKGVHLYYPYSGDRPARNKVRARFGGRQLELAVRADHGYVVGPGSTHPSGALYTREGSAW
jgi:putative DNA primase/helicase